MSLENALQYSNMARHAVELSVKIRGRAELDLWRSADWQNRAKVLSQVCARAAFAARPDLRVNDPHADERSGVQL